MTAGFAKKLIEAITVKVIVEIIVTIILAIFGSFGLGYLLSFANMQLPVWVAISLTFLALVIVCIVLLRKNKITPFIVAIPSRPNHVIAEFDCDMFGVKWTALYGGTIGPSKPYVYIDGPYCPKCEYEMGAEKRGILFKKYHWKCVPCGKYYKCPEQHPSDAEKAVEKWFEAEIRTGRVRIP
jgi:hypothetical protein